MIVEDVWKAMGVGENITVFGKSFTTANYCCHLCEAPALTKHAVAFYISTARKQHDDCFKT